MEKWAKPTKPISFYEVKELYDNAFAVVADLPRYGLLIRKANRLQERYINQLNQNTYIKSGVL